MRLFKDMGQYCQSTSQIKKVYGDTIEDYIFSFYLDGITSEELYYPVLSKYNSLVFRMNSFAFFAICFDYNLRISLQEIGSNEISINKIGYRTEDWGGNIAGVDYENPENNNGRHPLYLLSAIVDNSPYKIEPDSHLLAKKIKFTSTIDPNIWFYLELKPSYTDPGYITYLE